MFVENELTRKANSHDEGLGHKTPSPERNSSISVEKSEQIVQRSKVG